MMRTGRWTAGAAGLIAVTALVLLPAGLRPASSGQRPVTCVTVALPAATPSGALRSVGGGSATPGALPSIVPPIGTAAPISVMPGVVPSAVLPITTPGPVTTVPAVMLLTPHPATGAYVVPVTTAMPSVPGVLLTRPEVLIPPAPGPGQSRSAVAAGLVQSALGPAGSAGGATPLVVCY